MASGENDRPAVPSTVLPRCFANLAVPKAVPESSPGHPAIPRHEGVTFLN
jgi:hypothetical protein